METDDYKFKSEVLVNLGGLESEPDKAIAYLQQAAALDPEYAAAHYNLGIKLEKKGLIRKAEASYKKALELNPRDILPMIKLIWIYMQCKDSEVKDITGAIKLAERARKISRGRSVSVLEALAGAYSEAGRYDNATATAKAALMLARNQGRKKQAVQIRNQLQLYLRKMPVSAMKKE